MSRRFALHRKLALAALAFVVAGSPGATVPGLSTYVVSFDAPPAAHELEMLRGVAAGVHGYRHLPAAAVIAAPSALGLLRNLPGVRDVYPNRVLEYALDNSVVALQAHGVWADGYDGAGIGIAIVDAGVDGTHPDLCAAAQFCNGTPVKTVQNVKFIGNQTYLEPVVVLENQVSTDSTSGHGSHVAGIAAGAGTASETPSKYRGVAPGAHVIGLGTGEVLEVVTVLAAFDWILANHSNTAYNIKVVNNSWGPGAGAQYDLEEPVQRGIAAMHDAGLVVVFGAGNDGPKTGTINVFGANPKAISAAGSTKTEHLALFSSRGVPGSPHLRPTVTAPGQFIASVRARTGFYAWIADATGPDPNDPIGPPDNVSYAYASGTSMASPHVAGLAALIQQAAIVNLGRYLTPAEVRNVIRNTAASRDPSRSPGGLPNYQGYSMGAGFADALAAVRAVAAGTGWQPYDDGVVEDVRAFVGTITANSSFENSFIVQPGAISLDVMADWQHAAQNAALQDLDIDLYRPDGSLFLSTTLLLGLSEGPNQYSSLFTNQPNERLNVNAPQPGLWRVVVKGNVAATETAFGMWSVVYPDGTALAPPQTATQLAISAPPLPVAAGQVTTLTATLRDPSGEPVPNAVVTWSSTGVGTIVTSEPRTDERGMALATARSDVPGVQTAMATSGAATGAATVTWVGLPAVTLPPPPASTPGKASGGGHISNPGKKHFAFFAEYKAQAGGLGGELSFEDKATGFDVVATALSHLTVSGHAATLKGEARVDGMGGYAFTLDVFDDGQGSQGNDRFRLRLTQPLNPLYGYDTGSQPLSGGNIRVRAD